MSSFSVSNLPDHYVINTNARQAFQEKSCFYQKIHCAEQNRIHDEFFQKILSIFDRRFNINDLEHTARVWDFVLKGHEIKWCAEDDLTVATFKRIEKAFGQALLFSGRGVDAGSAVHPDIDAMCSFLLSKGELPAEFLNWENLKKILFVQDATFLHQFREALQQILKTGLESFQAGQVSESVFKGFVYNIIALLPYAYPLESGKIEIPLSIDGRWQMVPYHIDKKFTLSPSWFSSPLPAYGLLSDVTNAPPLISCLGTTYPAGDGFIATVLSDFTPGFSVGQAATLWGAGEIATWLNQHRNAVVTGVSLGGAISLHLSSMYPEAISEVWAFNPAGLYPWNWWGVDHSSVNYKIYYNENDLVATMGIFPEGDNVEIYRVLAEKSENFLAAHPKVYLAANKTTIIQTSATYENRRWERICLTTLHFLFSSIIFLTLLPFQLIYKLIESLYCCFYSFNSNVEMNSALS